jgi:penicillin-binding protein 2
MSNPFNSEYQDELGKLKKPRARSAEAWSISLMPGWLTKARLYIPQKPKSIWGLLVSIGFIFILYVVQLGSLQIVQGQEFVGIANGNRIRDNVSFAQRGKIYDRNGVVLADNTASFQLVANPYLIAQDKKTRAQDYQKISAIIGMPEVTIKKIVEAEGLDHVLPILVESKLTHEQVLKLDLLLPEIQGFTLDTIPIRKYVDDANLSHVLGYVGRASETDVKNRDDILPIDFVGQAGVEQYYDEQLRGVNGGQRTEIDAAGRPIRVLANNPSKPGKDLTLTIDIKIQKALTKSLQTQMKKSGGKVASAVVLNPKDGSVLALTSLPGYDNNKFSGGISSNDYASLTNNPQTPLFNRVTSSGYPTGSAIKPLVAAAALQEKVITPQTTIVDRGKITLVNQYNPADSISFSNFEGGVNGPIQLKDAIAKSSNVFFYTLGGGYENVKGLGPYRLPAYYRKFGLGKKTGIDLPVEGAGLVPDPNWNKKVLNADWYTGDSYNIAIGQGNLQISPLQLAVAHSSIINGGEILRPHLKSGDKHVTSTTGINKKHLKSVREGMRAVVEYGTLGPSYFRDLKVKVAGKTGTAETVTRSESQEPHVWISAHAPYEDPEIIVVAMIENGRRSGQYLGPVAADVFRAYFNQ